MNKKHSISVVVAAFLLLSGTASANLLTTELAMGYDYGGDNILKVYYNGGETNNLKAGEGLFFKGGFGLSLNEAQNFDLVGLIGWKYAMVSGSNGDAWLSRFPVDLGLRYKIQNHAFSAGITHDLGVNYSGDGVLDDVGVDLESDVGFSLQYEYAWSSDVGVGLRYNSLSYEITRIKESVDANSIGLSIIHTF
jgi:hypothetical protein